MGPLEKMNEDQLDAIIMNCELDFDIRIAAAEVVEQRRFGGREK